MESVIVEFKVAMDAEQAKLKNHKEVTLKVDFPDEVMDEVYKAATKSYVIDMQGQIRNNWDKFMDCDLPEVLVFGQSIFGKKVKVVKQVMTSEEIQEASLKAAQKMTPEEKAAYIQKLMAA